jgi:hypothetical protein
VEPADPGEAIDFGLIYWCLSRLPGTLPAAPPELTFRQALMVMEDRSKDKEKGGMSWEEAREWALEKEGRRERDPWGVGVNGDGARAGG